jgi:aspartyl protease family protein
MRAGLFIAILFGGVLAASVLNEVTVSEAAVPGLDPDSQPAGVAWLAKSEDGHFYAEALVVADRAHGSRVRFMVDTGATTVALTPSDALRIGLDLENLVYDAQARTANGSVRAARVTLDQVTVSGVKVQDVEAVVLEDGLEQSLLGMSYLGALSKIETSGESLILRR